jgi:hypothetical protein
VYSLLRTFVDSYEIQTILLLAKFCKFHTLKNDFSAIKKKNFFLFRFYHLVFEHLSASTEILYSFKLSIYMLDDDDDDEENVHMTREIFLHTIHFCVFVIDLIENEL